MADEEQRLPIAWQTSVVDIVPTSLYEPLLKAPDTAFISTTVGVRESPRVMRRPTTQLVPGTVIDEVEGLKQIKYSFTFYAPEEFTTLEGAEGAAKLSVVILLPHLPPGDPVLGRWKIERVDWVVNGKTSEEWAKEPDPQVVMDQGKIGGRHYVAYHTAGDYDDVVQWILQQIPRWP